MCRLLVGMMWFWGVSVEWVLGLNVLLTNAQTAKADLITAHILFGVLRGFLTFLLVHFFVQILLLRPGELHPR